MKIKNIAIYYILITACTTLFLQANANEIDESRIVRNPITVNSLQDSHNAEFLLSESHLHTEISNEEEIAKDNTPIEYTLTPLQIHPVNPMTVETANTLPQGAVYTYYGANIFKTGPNVGGTGLQIYNVGIDYGLTDDWQIGLSLSIFEDPLPKRINGEITDLGFVSVAPNFKYKFIDKDNYDVAIVGSLEWLKITSDNGLFNPTNNQRTDNTLAGTIQVPFTYSFYDLYQWHVVGGLSIFPNTVNGGGDFYGTFFNLGTGISFKLGEQFGFFSDINIPLGPGGNSTNRRGEITRNVVWSTGFNYLHSPTVGIDLSLTNRFGNTPATKLLTFLPNGGDVGVNVNVRYTPDINHNYRTSFDSSPLIPFSDRDKQLLFNGIILTSAETVRQGTFFIDTGYGPNFNFQAVYGMSDNAQLEFGLQQVADTGKEYRPIDSSFQAIVGTKLNFLNQQQGDPFSLALRGSFQQGGDSETEGGGGFSAETTFLYSFNDKIAVTFNPKGGFFGDNRILGAGLGFNLQPFKGFQVLGEVTPMVSNDPTIWAAGVRYMPPKNNFGIGVYTSNTAGVSDLGTMIRQADNNVTVGFNIMWLLGKN